MTQPDGLKSTARGNVCQPLRKNLSIYPYCAWSVAYGTWRNVWIRPHGVHEVKTSTLLGVEGVVGGQANVGVGLGGADR